MLYLKADTETFLANAPSDERAKAEPGECPLCYHEPNCGTRQAELSKVVLAIGQAVLDMQVPEDRGGGFYFDEPARAKLGRLCELARREAKP